MGRRLLADEPVFRHAVADCAAAVSSVAGWSPLRALTDDDPPVGPGAGIDVIQPVLFTIQVGLTQLWRSWGVEPDAVVGHSLGEVAAAYAAGAVSLADAARIIVHRSRLLRKVSNANAGMAVVGLAMDEVQPRRVTVPLYSTVTGAAVDGTSLDARYWARNLREPVLFWPVVQRLAE